MINALLNTLFGCPHRRTTFPLTPSHRAGFNPSSESHHGTYVVCLDCGKEFDYNWTNMRKGAQVAVPPGARAETFLTAHR